MLTVNGWTLLAHPLFVQQLEKLTATVEDLKTNKPDIYAQHANTKLLTALSRLVFDIIPSDPTSQSYRQGTTLGPDYKHWFRAKFGGGRFRLFFRYDSASKIIIYAWVNDEHSLRTYGAKTDAYRVFKSLLDSGNPPDNWQALLAHAETLPMDDGGA
jgi:toxin YhaV